MTAPHERILVVDASSPFSGVGKYCRSLFQDARLSGRIGHVRLNRSRRQVVLSRGYDEGEEQVLGSVALPLPASLWNPVAGRSLPPDAPVHLSTQNLSLLGEGFRIVTVHDLFYLSFPRSPVDLLLGRYLYRGLSSADLLVCDSHATADDLRERFAPPEERIRVVPLFVEAPSSLMDAVPAPGGRPYLLHVSSEEPRKNFDIALATFARLLQSARFADLELVKIGRAVTPRARREHLRLAAELGVAHRLRILEGVAESALEELYRGAHALLMPSSAEGFGFPLLEAMRCGCPVVAGDIGALREIGGSVASYAPPRDAEALAAQVQTLPESGATREELSRRCRAQAAEFSKERFVRSMEEIYRRVLD